MRKRVVLIVALAAALSLPAATAAWLSSVTGRSVSPGSIGGAFVLTDQDDGR